ncbi:MAG TPA: hypothetical protein VMQ83_00155 [Gammaproteobacteria bacterium]|nr:hypothetical protein [Gammaproteobacteria bacterium]
MTTTALKEALKELKALGNERMRAQNRKNGAGDRVRYRKYNGR